MSKLKRPKAGPISYGRNPTGDEFAAMADDGRRFMAIHHIAGIGHDPVAGGIPEGEVFAARDLGPGTDLDRLIRLDAMREVYGGSDAVAEAQAKAGDGWRDLLRLIEPESGQPEPELPTRTAERIAPGVPDLPASLRPEAPVRAGTLDLPGIGGPPGTPWSY